MFKKILVPVDIDYPKTAALVYQKAAELGAPTGAEIRLISVMPGYSMPIVASFVSEELVKQTKEKLRRPWKPSSRRIAPSRYPTRSKSVKTGKRSSRKRKNGGRI